MTASQTFYTDFMYKKLKPKSEILEARLETTEQYLSKANETHAQLYNVSLPTQDDVWICGRIFSENASGGGGKLTEHNVALQGSYVCSNSHSVSLGLSNCAEYSLFPGQIVLAHGRNPDGRRFICKEIVEVPFLSETGGTKLKNEFVYPLRVPTTSNKELDIIVAAGPYMPTGSTQTSVFGQLVQHVKSKNAQVLILLGPFLDLNHDLISSGNISNTFEELLQAMLDDLAAQLKGTNVQVVVQPSLSDACQDPIYPVAPFHVSTQFMKHNDFFHFLQEPSLLDVNDVRIALTSTDVIKDLTSMTVSKSSSSDKISRNFAHLMRSRSFYPIYPPPDHVCLDMEAWARYARIDTNPKVFIAVSDLMTFNKEVNNCTCINPGRLVRGTSTGTYAHLTIKNDDATDGGHQPKVSVVFNKV